MKTTTTPRERPILIRGLTVHQPWAWLIAAGHKDIENRSWAPPPSMVGGWLAIHAGKGGDDFIEIAAVISRLAREDMVPMSAVRAIEPLNEGLHRGSILAVARLTGSVRESASPWFAGPIGWTLAEVVDLPEPVPCRGAQGLWALPADVAVKVLSGWAQARPGATLGGMAR